MTEKKEQKKILPPYIPYKTLHNFLDSIKVAVPNVIDRSVMRTMSGVMQSQLISALEYLQLIESGTGAPTELLTKLVHSEGPERQAILRKILTTGYDFIFGDGLDLKRTTENELQQRFTKAGTSGDTTRKAMAFFMNAAKSAGIELSPHIKKTRGPRPGTVRAKRKVTKKTKADEATSPHEVESMPSDEVSWEKLLLSKFPSFDPSWPDDVKNKWFDGFKDLMKAQQDKDEE